MALASLSATLQVIASWQAQGAQPSSLLPAESSNGQINQAMNLRATSASTTTGGANEVYAPLTTLAPSAATTFDLTTFTDVVGTTASSFGEIKGILCMLLSTAQDATNGTTAVAIALGNNGTTLDFLSSTLGYGWFGSSASSMIVPNGGFLVFGVGATNAPGVPVTGTSKKLKVASLDAATTAAFILVVFGGYP